MLKVDVTGLHPFVYYPFIGRVLRRTWLVLRHRCEVGQVEVEAGVWVVLRAVDVVEALKQLVRVLETIYVHALAFIRLGIIMFRGAHWGNQRILTHVFIVSFSDGLGISSELWYLSDGWLNLSGCVSGLE